jgi:acyl-CoA synthetase (AMP-forming)/AMP-acid ligase II
MEGAVHTGMLLAMTAGNAPDRSAIGSRNASGPGADGLSFAGLAARAGRAGGYLSAAPGSRVGLLGENSSAVPAALFGSSAAGKPFVPLNYRLTDDRLRALAARIAPATVIADEAMAPRLAGLDGITLLARDDFLQIAADPGTPAADLWSGDPEAVAVQLFTSGTTGEPKAALLRHRHLAAYVISTVDFLGAGGDECVLISVPPYHIAGISALLSAAFAGRRVVQLGSFGAAEWVKLAAREQVTHAMIVPTMLDRILDEVEARGDGTLASLRNLSYGGGPMPLPVIERAMRLLPGTDFVNAYGLTETSSTIALLGPDDHRAAAAADDPAIRARLGSVGRPLPGVELSVRDSDGIPVAASFPGEIWVRGEQVGGEYAGQAAAPNGGGDLGWFRTRDGGYLDGDGFLFVTGRLDDVIVRGGENLSPGEIEAVLACHPAVAQAAVFGLPDERWGERVAAAVVPVPGAAISEDELRAFVRTRLRSTKTPDVIVVRPQLPYNETGKLLRRVLREELSDGERSQAAPA